MGTCFVFLDIDGVLLPIGDSGPHFPDSCLAAFSRILKETGATVVLSSTWRVDSAARSQILGEFRRYGERFGGPLAALEDFEFLTNPSMHSVRQWEIVDWLDRIAPAIGLEVESWVALDDDESVLSGEKFLDRCREHAVEPEAHTGLTEADADRAIALLAKQRESARVDSAATSASAVAKVAVVPQVQQSPPPWHLVDLVWHLDFRGSTERAPLLSLSMDVTVVSAAGAAADSVPLYIAPIFARLPYRRSDSTVETAKMLLWYGGLQTQCGGYVYPEPSSNSDARRELGSAAIFSRWEERRAECVRPGPGSGLWESSGYEGDFVSVRNAFPFSAQHRDCTYRCEWIVEEGGWMTMRACVVGEEQAASTVVGSLRFDEGELLVPDKLWSFVEVYGEPREPSTIPATRLRFHNLRINGVELGSVAHGVELGKQVAGPCALSGVELVYSAIKHVPPHGIARVDRLARAVEAEIGPAPLRAGAEWDRGDAELLEFAH